MKIQEFVKQHGIENVRFLVPMRTRFLWGQWGFSDHTKYEETHECVITEDPKETRYKLEDNYKVSLKSLKDGQVENYYISDLDCLISQDKMVKMESKPAFVGEI